MKVEIVHDVVVSPNLAAGTPSVVCVYPSMTVLRDGSIVCVYRQGTAKHSRDGVFYAQRSGDGGRSWSKPVPIYDGMSSQKPECVHTGVVCETPGGVLLAFFTTVAAVKPDAYIFGEEGRRLWQRPLVSASTDGGHSWKAARQLELSGLPHSAYIASRPLILPDGGILLPIEITDTHGQETMLACVSTDEGLSFEPALPIAKDETGGLGYGDGKFDRLADGTLIMLAWTYRNPSEETIRVHRCESRDGRTWSPPQPTNVVCQIMTPLQMAGSLIIAAGNVRTPPEGIRLFHSRDCGKTWDTSAPVQLWDPRRLQITGAVLPIEAPPPDREGIWGALPSFTFGSPELAKLGEDEALMTYYAIIEGITHVRACRFRIIA